MRSETTLLGLRQATLALAPHDVSWMHAFEAEAARIRVSLPDVSLEIHHIGSTAVPGLPAKPILDIAIRADAEAEQRIADALIGLGYIDRGVRSGRLFIRLRDGDVRTHNLHLYTPDDPDFRDQIAFRDALRADADLRIRYATLKQDLVEQLGDEGRGRYADGKTAFVLSALQPPL
ncbi:GrpB family protein [Maribius pontilimi]|uniref:GrpB family protein n=1 Tax=Palleronia pontilimi TaxID=1964209 RepID=A0A934MF54_9RHOB|nr:GrpB family protein [Palleronia pontilimi]MBJ3764146.1 GrpB family protein [Palleronia pontilimi]